MKRLSFKKASLMGIAFLLVYNILISLKEVVSGHIVQALSPFLLVFLTFTFCGIVFQIISLIKYRDIYFKPFSDFKTLVKVNISTVGAWVGFFYGVKYLEPAIVSTLAGGFGPAIATLFQSSLKPIKIKIHPIEKLSAIGILIRSVILSYISLTGMSSIKLLDAIDISKGIFLTLLSSVCVVITTYYTKRISDMGCSPPVIMAHRFYLLTPFSLIFFLLTNEQPISGSITDNINTIWDKILFTIGSVNVIISMSIVYIFISIRRS